MINLGSLFSSMFFLFYFFQNYFLFLQKKYFFSALKKLFFAPFFYFWNFENLKPKTRGVLSKGDFSEKTCFLPFEKQEISCFTFWKKVRRSTPFFHVHFLTIFKITFFRKYFFILENKIIFFEKILVILIFKKFCFFGFCSFLFSSV